VRRPSAVPRSTRSSARSTSIAIRWRADRRRGVPAERR
jgi:hypothetical protein